MSVQALLLTAGQIVFDWTVWNNVELGLGVIEFRTDGTTVGTQGTDPLVPLANWYSPTTAGIGGSRWVEFNLDGVWRPLSTPQQWWTNNPGGVVVPFRFSTTNSAAGVYRVGYISMRAGG